MNMAHIFAGKSLAHILQDCMWHTFSRNEYNPHLVGVHMEQVLQERISIAICQHKYGTQKLQE
jgi:hypothetical protein